MTNIAVFFCLTVSCMYMQVYTSSLLMPQLITIQNNLKTLLTIFYNNEIVVCEIESFFPSSSLEYAPTFYHMWFLKFNIENIMCWGWVEPYWALHNGTVIEYRGICGLVEIVLSTFLFIKLQVTAFGLWSKV